MPLHEQVTVASVLANYHSDAASLNARMGAVNQDLENWRFFLDDQNRRIGLSSVFTEKYYAFEKIMRRIDSITQELQKPSQPDASQVEYYEKQAVEIYDSIVEASKLHRDKGAKGAAKMTFFRKPQSAIDFEKFCLPPSYRQTCTLKSLL